MARYADLKRERDEAVRRAVEAERFSRKAEVDRLERQLEERASKEGELAAKLWLTRNLVMESVSEYVAFTETIDGLLRASNRRMTQAVDECIATTRRIR